MRKLLIVSMTIMLGLTLSVNGALAHDNDKKDQHSLDINAYCSHTGAGVNSSVITGTQNWACSNNGTGDAINLHKVCQYEYNTGELRQLVKDDPYTYVCIK